MVFTHLNENEKHAFFELLDEYFSSRPEIFAGAGADNEAPSGSAMSPPANQAASAVHRALAANPEATANLISAGLRHGASVSNTHAGGPGGGATPGGGRSAAAGSVASAAANPEISNAIGRVAAASLAFGKPAAGGPGKPPPPPVLPRRTSPAVISPVDRSSPSPPPFHAPAVHGSTSGSQTSKLVSGRSFGDVDTSSFTRSVSTLRNSTANKSKKPPSVAPPIPSAFPKQANSFAPPPMRRVSSTSPTPPPAQPEPEEEEAAEEEEEEEGEWAEALYDYNSGEAGDLVIRARERIKVINKDSDDWWSGEVNGRSGLFPASYVKIL